ncbi:HpsJ family protein [Anabaena sp. CCY 0017]|uniref:HpsJ-like protein, cyanoexosortase C-associated n=1 Tax=Anabaena sp. CCY 0017 TaxID=3103866 RepID=UPI0039C640E8
MSLPAIRLPQWGLTKWFRTNTKQLLNSFPLRFRSVGHQLGLIVGLACIFGFLVDLTGVALPLKFLEAEWRFGVLRMVSDRSIVLIAGLALLSFGLLDARYIRQMVSRFCLILGVVFILSGVLGFRDTIQLRDQAIKNIDTQSTQALRQLEAAKSNPEKLDPNITPERLQQVSQELQQQAQQQKYSNQARLYKLLSVAIGNLVVSGLALIAIGRLP